MLPTEDLFVYVYVLIHDHREKSHDHTGNPCEGSHGPRAGDRYHAADEPAGWVPPTAL
jgi:hypothetical protein